MNDPFSMTYDGSTAEPPGSGNLLSHIPTILWHRRWWIIVPAVLGIVATILAMVFLPPVYRSTAIMLVVSPQLPSEVLQLDGTEVVDRRIARIRQQITARPDLLSMIEQRGLYVDERKSEPMSAIVQRMRENIVIAPNKSGGPRKADDQTIAFELSFFYGEPEGAQAVVQDLMDKILSLDASTNVEQATNTVQFLTDQAKGLETQMAALQGQISQITAANGAALSGAPFMTGGTGSYDVQIASLQRDNQQLISQRDLALTSDERDPVVVAAEQQLAGARAVYAESHPDVVFAKQRLAEARELAKSNTGKLPVQAIDQQIAFNNSQIAALRSAKAQEEARIQSRLASQAQAPLVQQRIGDLQQRLAALNQQYEQVQSRLMNARAGVRAEDEQMGERLVVVEPPIVPEEPMSPNRPLIALVGILGSLGLGAVLALAVEFLLAPIRDPSALAGIPGVVALGVVPVIDDKTGPRTRRWWPFSRARAAGHHAGENL